MQRNYNPKDLSNEQLINEYYHVRADAEAYEVSSDVELLPMLKVELLSRLLTEPEKESNT